MEVEQDSLKAWPYQASHDATELDNVCIGNCIEAPDQRVKDGHASR